jgi:cell division protein FtsQ
MARRPADGEPGVEKVDKATRRSRKRFARRQWRRRWLAWRYLLAGVLVIALVVVGVYAVWFSTWLAVTTVDVSGAQTVSAAEIRQRAGIDDGTPLVRVDVSGVEDRVASLPVVRSVKVTRQWPHGILISLQEREPVAVVQIGQTLRGMDEDGVVFRSYKRAPVGLPKVETSIGTTAAALKEAATVVRALPSELSLRVDHVSVQTVDQISLVLKDGRTVVWGSSEQSDVKAKVAIGLLGQTQAKVVNVSVPSKPTTDSK